MSNGQRMNQNSSINRRQEPKNLNERFHQFPTYCLRWRVRISAPPSLCFVNITVATDQPAQRPSMRARFAIILYPFAYQVGPGYLSKRQVSIVMILVPTDDSKSCTYISACCVSWLVSNVPRNQKPDTDIRVVDTVETIWNVLQDTFLSS